MRKLLGMLVAVLTLAWVTAPAAMACDCEPVELEQLTQQADVVAHVRVVEVNFDDEATHIFADVLRSWKGAIPPQLHIVSPAEGGEQCGIPRPEEGSQLLILAEDQNLSYRVDVCSGTRTYTGEDAGVQELGDILGKPSIHRAGTEPDPRDVREEPDEVGFSWVITSLSAGALLIIGILVYRYEARHGKQRRRG